MVRSILTAASPITKPFLRSIGEAKRADLIRYRDHIAFSDLE
jgi:hypothetical protein